MTEYDLRPRVDLETLARDVLLQAGADDENAQVVAEHLALADASGMSTHGIVHLPGYVHDIEAGGILPTAKPRVVSEEGSIVLLHGGWTFGQVAALEAIDLGVRSAADNGVALVGLVGAHHIGRLGHFVERAAAAGCMAMLWAGGYGEQDPHVAAYGGQDRVVGTNPIAFGFPGGETPPLSYDFATTAVAGMRVVQARQRGEQLAPGSIIGPGGVPTTDPEDFFRGGAHVPFGGHKGYAISLAAEWLGRVFIGSDRFAEPGRASAILGHQGVLFVVARADAFAPADQVTAVADEMYHRIGTTRTAPGFDRVMLPGQLEAEARARSEREGVRVDPVVWKTVSDLLRGEGR